MKAPRTLATFRIEASNLDNEGLSVESFQSKVLGYQWTPCLPAESDSVGFLGGVERLFIEASDASVLSMVIRVEKKTPPRSLVQDIFRSRIRAKNQAGIRVSREEQTRLKSDIRAELLPDTLPDYKHIGVYFFEPNKAGEAWLCIDKSSSDLIESALDCLLQAGIISARPGLFIDDKAAEKAFQSRSVDPGSYRATGRVRMFHRNKGLYDTTFDPSSPIDTGEAEVVETMYFENAELSFSLRYDGVIGQLTWSFLVNSSVEDCLSRCLHLVESLVSSTRG